MSWTARRIARRSTADGSYILRSNVTQSDATTMWSMYMQLVWIESAFQVDEERSGDPPDLASVQPRVEAHIFVAFMGYCLMARAPQTPGAGGTGLSPPCGTGTTVRRSRWWTSACRPSTAAG